MISQLNRNQLWIFFGIVFIYIINLLVSPGFNGGADSITHYQISKFSWKHHYLFMDQWGKPLFNILFSPFAQLGFKVVNIVNILLIFWGAYLSVRIAQNLKFNRPLWVGFITLLTPIVLGNAISGLTEPICSLFLIGFLYYATLNRWYLAAFLLGFMPFARSEGFVMVALALIFFILTKRWKAIPFLLMGTIIFNSLGFYVTGKALWIFDNNPYINTGIKVYGSGSFFHFFIMAIPVFGLPFLLLLYYTTTQLYRLKDTFRLTTWSNNDQIEFWLILASFWGYFLAHTVLWWQGMWASLGLVRVMFVVAVPFALMVVKGWEFLEIKNPFWRSVRNQRIFLILIAITPFIVRLFPFQEIQVFPKLGTEEKVNRKLFEQLTERYDIGTKKTYTAHPYINLLLDIDPFDTLTNDRLHNWHKAQPGDLVIWDGHFGPNEEQVFKEDIEKDSTFTFAFAVKPDKPFITLNRYWYEIRVYEKH